MSIIIGISLNFLYMVKYKYGQNELDLQNLITNLSNNVDSYVQSKTDWSQAQKESFKEGYRNYITGLQDQLNNNTDRFSADEFGTITDKQGQIKNNTDTDYVYNKKGELLDPTTTSEKKLKKGTPFYRNQEVAIFNNIIAKGMVDKMKEKQQNIPSLADYWQQQYNPKGDLADYTSVAALDKKGEYTNRIAEIKGLWDRYKQKYQLSPEQTSKYEALINSLDTEGVGTDKWKNQIIRNSAAAGVGKFFTGYLGFDAPKPKRAFNINNDEDVIKRYQLEATIATHPELREKLLAYYRDQYRNEGQKEADAIDNYYKQQAAVAHTKKLNEFWRAHPALYDVRKRNTENFSIGVETTNSKLSNSFIDPLKPTQWNSNILETLQNANRTGNYFYTKFKNPIKLTTGHTINNLGEFYSYLFPILEKKGYLTMFDKKQDKAGNTIYRLKNSKNKAGEWLYMFKIGNGKLRTYRSKSYQNLLPKAQVGIKLDSYTESKNEQQKAVTKARAKATGKTYQQQKIADSVTTKWTPQDKARMAGVGLDIASMITGVTGVGAGASAALGLGSTGANLYADLTDGSMSTWQAIKNAGLNVGFDAIGMFGGVGKGGKIARTLIRYTPRILYVINTIKGLQNVPEITASFKKLTNKGWSSLTVQDWQNISQGIGLVTGIVGGAGRKIKQHNNTIQGNKVGVKFKDKKTGESKIFTFEGNDAKAIRNAKNDAEIQTITNKYNELKGFELQHVNKLSGLHWQGMKDSNTFKYQLPVTTQSQKTQLYDVYSDGNVTWTNKAGIRGWLQPYGGQTIDARHSLLSDDSKSSAGSDIDSSGQRNEMHKRGGVIKASIGIKTPWFNGLQPVNKDTDFKSNWDTSTLYAGDTSKGLISPYASTKTGKAIGRYTPTEGYTREQARTVEQGNLYKNFINNLFNENGNFNEVGEAWAKKVDNLIPHDSTASFYDPKTKTLRTQWVTTNNNIYGDAPKTYTNLRDYVQNVMNDNIIGARHNIFVKKGKRYFYKDTNGNIVYVNPQDLSKYNVSDKGNDVFENGTLWSDYELTGLKPEATTFGTNINNEIKKKTSVNISNLLNSLSPTKTYGLARAIAAARNNSRMLSKSITQPMLLDPNEIHRNVYSDLGSEMQGQQQAAELQRLATTQAGADFDRNAAMTLDAKLKGIKLKDLKFKNSNDLQRQSAEASWAQEKDNKQSRWQAAQTNREAIYENDIANLQRKLATQAQNFQIWDTFAQQLQQEAATDWQVNRARMDSMVKNDINSAIRNNIKAYVSDISPEDEQLWNEIQSGKKSSTTLTPTESARFRILSEKANQAKYEQLRQYYKMPKNIWSNYTIGNRVFAPVIKLSAKDGGKLQVARLRAATADADRFYKTTKDFADRTERAIARLTTKKKKKKQ